MKILSVSLKNFASYKDLDFTFNSQGLTLIHGATGSGKSTLADAIPWVLFGTTSKGGPVADVLSWHSNEPTVGECQVQLNENLTVQVQRTRGKNNDLWFRTFNPNAEIPYPINNKPQRGKDIPDTQKLINDLLGLTPELYLSAAYYHEFSQTAQFFTTTAKNRRTIIEQLVDLSLPKKLQEKVIEQLKYNKQDIQQLNNTIDFKTQLITKLDKNITWEQETEANWQTNLKQRMDKVQIQIDYFDTNQRKKIMLLQAEIEKLDVKPCDFFEDQYALMVSTVPSDETHCKECGTIKSNPERDAALLKLQQLKDKIEDNVRKTKEQSKLEKQLDEIVNSVNPYLDQLDTVSSEVNHHAKTISKYKEELMDETVKLVDLEWKSSKLKTNKADLETLEESVVTFRSLLIKNTILDLETQTNRLLHNHFEGEIRIKLLIESDKLEVNITKDGNQANYTQLSKGQRCMLKLCFAVAVMKAVQNHHGISINQLWLDEALDGLDDNMKLKAVGLLEKLTLDYDSIYLVEHSETVKALVDQKIHVELVNGQSQITR